MREYAARYQDDIATPEGLLAALEEVSGESLADWYAEWITGKRQ
ncbi:MAG: hypothetical protein NUW24_10180 [Anaerolineae bacterium]|nr:hypothetical protein [Anaerolineae bacterium]MDH7473799.1 hypothetical protein [Anaerolineae bacterium]